MLTLLMYLQPKTDPVNEPPFTLNDGFVLFWRTVRDFLKGSVERLPYLLVGLFVFLLFWVLGKVVQKVINKVAVQTHAIDNMLANLVSRIVGMLITILGFLVACVVIFPSFKPGDIIAGLGITSVAIGFAFKDILQNFFAGLLILWRRPFRVGDQIRVKEFEGTVEDINMRSTRLKTYDGERVILPNGDVYTSSITVRTAFDKRRVKFVVGIGYPDSIEEARQVIHHVLAGVDGVLTEPAPWVYVSELAGSSVNLTVYFWTESHQANVLKISDQVVTQIKLALDKASIDMPYPHTVVLLEQQPSGPAILSRPALPAQKTLANNSKDQ
ncbi:mechanosensitive ion channel family protein [Spirosoma sp. KUDC1026]|uniref:mechanosensitive ion channel family protein n=1 Tax=Spirosoma sp. KUDC1026 TaxID=2745947 RepID=UPI00159BA8D6|nr:mechanosensitive ion channel family protein [Spirosoma sp. KUDC1026]QKZ11313.1 mechanosensitive ion channel family protein [Spirosoma sp. KUDC1026]